MSYIGQPFNGPSTGAVQHESGNGSTTAYTLDFAVGSSESVATYLDGVRQVPGSGKDYTAAGTTLTFSTAVPSGVSILIQYLALPIALPEPGNTTVTKAKITTTLINEHVDTTITAADSILYSDATDSNANKKDTVQGILDLVPATEGVKVWINFNGTSTVAIRDSFNVTSITDNATGDYTVTIATDFANINYSIASPSAFIAAGAPQHHTVFNRVNSSGVESAPTVTAFRMTTSMDGTSTDAKYVYASAFGD